MSSGHREGLPPALGRPWLEVTGRLLQGAVEPMQIDVDPQEDPQNAPDVNYVVENPTLVGALPGCQCCWVRAGAHWTFHPNLLGSCTGPCVASQTRGRGRASIGATAPDSAAPSPRTWSSMLPATAA